MLKGQKMTEEQKIKVSLGKKGKPSGFKGKKHTKKTKKALSRLQSGRYVGEKHPNWKGGKIIDHDGSILIYKKNHPFGWKQGYVLESRLIAEKCLGRYLCQNEVVHHIDKNNQNNQVNNLFIFENGIEHMRFHNLSKKNKFLTSWLESNLL